MSQSLTTSLKPSSEDEQDQFDPSSEKIKILCSVFDPLNTKISAPGQTVVKRGLLKHAGSKPVDENNPENNVIPPSGSKNQKLS